MGLFGGKPKIDVTEYSLSVHMGVCLGPVDAVTGIYANEKLAWEGRVTDTTVISIQKPDLFGGLKKEGGLEGYVHYLPGGPAQVLPESLASRLGLTSATAPAYRGKTSLWFIGASGARAGDSESGDLSGLDAVSPALKYALGRKSSGRAPSTSRGFVWGANAPYLPSVWVKAERAPKGLNPDLAMIGPDANPAHIIFECLTNTDWGGMGENPAVIDIVNFNSVAQTLVNEEFGLSLLWTTSAKVEDFIGEIINHIQATLFVHPRTGLWTIKLLRDDYDVDSLPSFDDTNSSITHFQRRAYGEVANEIVLSWTNPESEENEAVSLQDLGAITAQGGKIVSDARDYPGIRNVGLAGRVCARDLRAAAFPLASVEATLDREGWDIVPGDVIKLSSIEHSFTNVVFRVTTIDYGKVDSSSITVSLMEDVFSLDYDNYYTPAGTQHADVSGVPSPLQFEQPFTVPSYLVPFYVDTEPADGTAIFAVMAGTTQEDTFEFDFAIAAPDPSGEEVFENQGTWATTSRGVLTTALAAEETSEFSDSPITPGEAVGFDSFIVIGEGADEDLEFALVRTSLDGLTWTMDRGVLDTVPRAWPVGTPFWVISVYSAIDDDTPRIVGESVSYKLLSRTSQGALDPSEAPTEEYTIGYRPYLPLRPANVKVNGAAFGEADVREAPTVTATWSNRNRLTETETVLPWTAPGVAPEVGQTTTIEVFTIDGTLVNTIDGISGETFEFDSYDFVGLGLARVRFTSKRDGLQSLQGHELIVRRLSGGWGYSYGFGWGGAA